MALEVHSKDDVLQGILAVAVAKLSAVSHGKEIPIEYCQGILETAEALTILYGGTWADLETCIVDAVSQELWSAVML